MTNNKKVDKYRKLLFSFLDNYKYMDNSNEKHTHTSYGAIYGKYTIPKEYSKDFIKIYSEAIKNNVNDLSILEVQPEYGPIIIDIDLKNPIDDCESINQNGRLYDNDLIISVIEKYKKAITTYLEIKDKNTFKIAVFEKKHKTELNDIYKDGFHIIFPDVIANVATRHLLRHKVVEMCREDNIFETFIDDVEKIIDKAVVSSNGWFLYGSKKPEANESYKLTKIYNFNLEVISNEELNLSDEDIIQSFSLHLNYRKYNKKNINVLLDVTHSEVNVEVNKLGININNTINNYEPYNKQIIINRAYKYSTLLSPSRANNYEEWRNVGLALHNTDDSLLYAWIEFSKKAPTLFAKSDQGGCPKIWKSFKTPSYKSLLTIRSLAYWAKLDNPKEYDIFIKEEFKKSIIKCSYNTFDIASAFYTKYENRFVCSSSKNNIWREYDVDKHRWVKIDDACIIKTLLSKEFADEYYKEAQIVNASIIKLEGEKRALAEEKYKTLNKIADKLKNIVFKKHIIEELKSLFLDSKFEEKLDSDENLLGFENGIYDLKQKKFRNGSPEDYVSFSTKLNYIPYSDKRPYMKKILEFLSQILPNEAVRKYKIIKLATCVSGSTKDETFLIDYGEGSNGKSLLLSDLLFNAFGDYYMSCPITIITRKRGSSNDASPEKVRMKGKRIGIFQETDDGDKLNVGIMKELTGGDKILVRDLFKGSDDMIEFKPQMKYILACNQLPTVPSNDDGTWRRIRVINFNSKFVNNPVKENEFKINTNLKHEVKNWGADFISYLIHIYETEYLTLNYIETPEDVMISTNQYKNENDYYTEYVNENIFETDNNNDTLTKTDIYKHFKYWYKEYYECAKPLKKTDIDKQLLMCLKNKFNNLKVYKNTFKNLIIKPKDDKKENSLDDLNN